MSILRDWYHFNEYIMSTRIKLMTVLFLFLSNLVYGQDKWTNSQQEVIETMNKLSETTSIEGNGADEYGSYLSDEFSRWTIGSAITNNKTKWVEGVREWFDEGWHVSERTQQILEILIVNDFAHTRRIVTETYLGPKKETSISTAALAELWIKKDNKWLLYRVNVHPIPNDHK